ncbi:TPA: hypothetical protein EYP66_24890 [Candidatus Poribacteria bacterium]|nr:hypothetical protein [Candidatus Poribacteria bacterium]
MTNTLHRRGSRESLRGDYVVFATTAGGYNREGSAEKLRTFMRIALKYNPVNISDSKQGVKDKKDLTEMIESMTDSSGAACAFDNLYSVRDMLLDLREADLGISINVSGLLDEVNECCKGIGINRHSIEHSLGISGQIDRLPNREILELNTLCGHGMISFNLIKRMIDLVKLGKLTPKQAAGYMAKPCVCGAFNPKRAEMILAEVKSLG